MITWHFFVELGTYFEGYCCMVSTKFKNDGLYNYDTNYELFWGVNSNQL